MWEYNRLDLSLHLIKDINEELNKLGEQDWEIVYYREDKPEKFGAPYKIKILLKRRKNGNNSN